MCKVFLVALTTWLFSQSIYAQDLAPGFKSWWELEASFKFNKKWKGSFSQIYSFETNPYEIGFIQNDFSVSYRIKKRTYLSAGYIWSWFKDSQSMQNKYNVTPNFIGMLDFNRIYVDYSYKHKLLRKVSKRLWLKHSGKFEWFFPQFEKYQYRLVYSAKLYYKVKNFPWHGVPYLENKFYVYLGGIPIDYYDSQGNVVATNAPNGLHRYRLKVGVRMKPMDARFYVTPYFFYQRELNFLSDLHGLNRLNPVRGTVKYRFNNYYVAGLRLAYTFKK